MTKSANQYENRRLNSILKTLQEVHGVELRLDNTVDDLKEAYAFARKTRERIIGEAQFNNYHRDPNYTKAVLIMEAIKIFLSEIAPKRMRKKPRRMDEREAGQLIKTIQNELSQPRRRLAESKGSDTMDTEKLARLMAVKERLAKIKGRMDEAKRHKARLTEGATKEPSEFAVRVGRLVEAEIEQYEVFVAAKSLSGELQDIAEKIGRMQVNDLMPLHDRMKTELGQQKGDDFNTSAQEALQAALTAVRDAKDKIDNALLGLEGKAGGDMADFGSDEGDEEPAGDLSALSGEDEGDLEDELADALGTPGKIDNPVGNDEFAGDAAAAGPLEEPLGRAKKESRKPVGVLIAEKKIDYDLPAEVQTAIDDFEYYLARRQMGLEESVGAAMERYRELYKAVTAADSEVMVTPRMVRRTLRRYIDENTKRIRRIQQLNQLRIPKPIVEAAESVGLTEGEFRTALLDHFHKAASRLDEKAYRHVVRRLGEMMQRNPNAVAQRFATMVFGDRHESVKAFEGFTRRVIDEAREKELEVDEIVKGLSAHQQDVWHIGEMHRLVKESGYEEWYNKGKAQDYQGVLEALARMDGKDIKKAAELTERAVAVIHDHRDHHGYLSEYGRDLLSQLDRRYSLLADDLEDLMGNYLHRELQDAA